MGWGDEVVRCGAACGLSEKEKNFKLNMTANQNECPTHLWVGVCQCCVVGRVPYAYTPTIPFLCVVCVMCTSLSLVFSEAGEGGEGMRAVAPFCVDA